MEASRAAEIIQQGQKLWSWRQVDRVGVWGCQNSPVMAQHVWFPGGGSAGLSGCESPGFFLPIKLLDHNLCSKNWALFPTELVKLFELNHKALVSL